MNAWMIWGPFSLADATDAKMDFWYRNKSESNFDYVGWYASTDNYNYSGYHISGDQNTWRSQTFDLKSAGSLGNLCGQSQVWIAFTFTSDSSVTDIGAFVDDIVVSKSTTSAQADLTPYHPSNWNDNIPVGTTQLSWSDAHSYTGSYYNDQTLYFNWGSLNNGAATASNYTVHAEVTGTGGGSWDWTGCNTDPTYWTHLTTDQAVGPLSAGSHTFKMWVDYTGVVSESNEGNNYYERTINVLQHVGTGQIHGAKWNDLDGDGVWDSGEPGLANWRIYLDTDNDGSWDGDSTEPSVLTDSNGAYAFTGLLAGTYTVAEVSQTGWRQTCPGGEIPDPGSSTLGTPEDVDSGTIVCSITNSGPTSLTDTSSTIVSEFPMAAVTLTDVPTSTWTYG